MHGRGARDDSSELSSSELEIDLSPVDRLVARTPLVAVGQYICPVDHPQFKGGGPETCPYIVFSRSTVKLLPSRGRGEVCSPVTVNLLDVGDSYERKVVSSEGVRCDWIALSPRLLRDIVREFNPALGSGSKSVFVRAVAPVSARAFLAQRQFFTAVQTLSLQGLALEESALRLVSTVLLEVLGAARLAAMPRWRRDGRTYEIVEGTKQILAQEFCSDLSVAEIAQRVHCSATYLSRIFSRLVGYSVHQYKQHLRLRSSLDLICEKRFNGAGIASELGFASHSHFTDVFRRTFGLTPSDFAKKPSSHSVATMREFLDIRMKARARGYSSS